MTTTVEIRRGRLRIHVEVTIEGPSKRGRIVAVTTKNGDPMREPMDSEAVSEACADAIEKVERQQAAQPAGSQQ